MFTDEVLDGVLVPSLWRKSHQSAQESRSCQTRAVHSADAEVQTASTSVSSTQTEPQDPTTELPHQPCDDTEAPGLTNFLRRVEDLMVGELEKNSRSHAFDGFQTNWQDHDLQVSCLHCLQHPGAQEKGLQVTSVSWSCTGSVIICSFGRINDGDWSNERSCVCTWNLDRRSLSTKQADLVIDVPTAVTALSCHPSQPALIAGGLYNGEVVVWDTSQTQDPVLAQTGMSSDSHREPVYQVAWVPLQKKGEFGVLSASSEGSVLLWMLVSDKAQLILNAAYALTQQQVPHSSSSSFKVRGSKMVGVTSLAVSPWDSDTFIVGSEGGLMLRCSFSSQTLAAVVSEKKSVELKAPAVFSFRSRGGPVYSIHCSPFHRNLFVSSGTDGLAHIHSLLQVSPLLSLRVSESYVFQVQWSPTRPLVFAAATGQGEVQVFDLGCRSLRPAATIKGGVGQAATCLAFNCNNHHLLAVGKADGTVEIWQLSADLTEQQLRESEQLDQIANQVVE
ncbi:WD repeat-containing protein 34 [Melanotaenia boesemani]|uniref:WD repeat-containing protein 34 n=1 Tax=Melanotaenia boesemani TaxID=1250792 RepID=UPI001C04DEF3|nr:WD repeat-containing protein 34 [Melanotaenia boesemani]